MIRFATRPTPIGLAFVATSERGLVGLYFVDSSDLAPALDRLEHDYPNVEKLEDPEALAPFLDRLVGSIDGHDAAEPLALDLQGTPFQLRVWSALQEIPRGETLTYGELAARLDLPVGAARAVGTACGANPVSYFVPCHRVIPAGGGLGGYRWGLERKRKLLAIERGASSTVKGQSVMAFVE